MNNKIIKITLFTLLCSLTNTNVYLANDENIDFKIPQEKQSQNNNTILKITAAGLTITSIALGLLALIQKNEILAQKRQSEIELSRIDSKERDINNLNKELRESEKLKSQLEKELAHKIKKQDQAEAFLLKLKNDLLNPQKVYTVRDLTKIRIEYEKKYFELLNIKKRLHYEDPRLIKENQAESALKELSDNFKAEAKRLLEEYNPSVAGQIDQILKNLEQPYQRS